MKRYIKNGLELNAWSKKSLGSDELIEWVKAGNPISWGADVRNKLKAVSVRDAYMKKFPTDSLGQEISDINFADVLDALNTGEDIYDVIGVGDSFVREGVFDILSELLNVDYDVIYYLWLKR